jgi:hypothetical protein
MKKVIYIALVAIMVAVSKTGSAQVTWWTITTTTDSACVNVNVNPTAVPMKVVYSLQRGEGGGVLFTDSLTTNGVVFGFKITFSGLDAATNYAAAWDVTIGNDPTNHYSATFQTESATGIEGLSADQFKAYCSGGNQIALVTPTDFVGSVMVHNLAGQLVATQAMASRNATIRLETGGMYFVSFLGANGAKVATKEIAVVK